MDRRSSATIGILALAAGAVLVVWFLGRMRPPSPGTEGRMPIAASFYALAEFARVVGGDAVTVTTITPTGGEPHEYEPSPQDIAAVYASRVFLFQGNGFDPWAERIADEVAAKGITVVHVLKDLGMAEEPEEKDDEERQDHARSSTDPHVWLDPVLSQKIVERIRDAFIAADPGHAEVYRKNAGAYLGELSALHARFERGLSSCKHRHVIVSHAAYGHLARRYGLEMTALVGLSTEEIPAPRRVSEIITIAREKGISTIFYDPLGGPRVAETIAREIGGHALSLNPIEGLTSEEAASGKTYIDLMDENLQHLRAALECT